MSGSFIDSHVHLTHEDFAPDLDEVIGRAKESNVLRFIVPATDRATSSAVLDLAARFGDVSAAVGIHPHDVSKAGSSDLGTIREMAEEKAVVAIGEIGLDYYYDFTPREEQRQFFRDQLALASEKDLPVIVHTRDSMDDALDIVARHVAEHPAWCNDGESARRGVFHCFTGSESQARKLFGLGFSVSFPGILTFKNSPVTGMFRSLNMERVLLETDAPYMAPVPYRGKRNEPAFMLKTAEKMAELTGMTLADIANQTTRNTVTLFCLED